MACYNKRNVVYVYGQLNASIQITTPSPFLSLARSIFSLFKNFSDFAVKTKKEAKWQRVSKFVLRELFNFIEEIFSAPFIIHTKKISDISRLLCTKFLHFTIVRCWLKFLWKNIKTTSCCLGKILRLPVPLKHFH